MRYTNEKNGEDQLGSGVSAQKAYEAYCANQIKATILTRVKRFFVKLFNLETRRFNRGVTFAIPVQRDNFSVYDSVVILLPARESEIMYQLWEEGGRLGPLATGSIPPSLDDTRFSIPGVAGMKTNQNLRLRLTLYAKRLGSLVLYSNCIDVAVRQMSMDPIESCGAIGRAEYIPLPPLEPLGQEDQMIVSQDDVSGVPFWDYRNPEEEKK